MVYSRWYVRSITSLSLRGCLKGWPILLIWGEESELPVGEMKRMKEVKGSMDVVAIKGANHFVPISHSEQVINAINSFLIG